MKMQTVQKIIDTHGGLEALRADYIRIEMGPRSAMMPLVIEHIGPGPRSYDCISVAHYGKMNGDAMRDPEMTFEIMPSGAWVPVHFENSYMGVYQEAMFRDDNGRVMIRPELIEQLANFMKVWDRNIRDHGYLDHYMSTATVTA